MNNILNKKVFITGSNRTPIGKFQGSISKVKASKLGSECISAAIQKSSIKSESVEYVIMGNMLTAGGGMTPARQSSIFSDIPESTSALTINKACASGIQSIILAAQSIQLDEMSIIVAGGMENMSDSPHVLVNSRSGKRLGNSILIDTLINDALWCPFENRHMGDSAEIIAKKYDINRDDQDRYAEQSHLKAVKAQEIGSFNKEITPVNVTDKKQSYLVTKDDGPRGDVNFEKLQSLNHAFTEGESVTPGNASQISDGASAMIISDEKSLESPNGPVAIITGYTHVANKPGMIFDAPPYALKKLLDKTNNKLSDFDLIEINEAFASVVLAWEKETSPDMERVNPNGGAIALGHPLGGTGAILMTKAVHELHRTDTEHALVTMCCGGGLGTRTLLQRL